MLNEIFITALFSGALIAAIPLLLAAFGEMLSEQAGVLNLGLEGMMLAGAYSSFYVAYQTDSLWLGFLAGAFAGLCIAAIMAIFCVWFAMNQIIIGIALTFAVQGITALLHYFTFANSYPRLSAPDVLTIPWLSDIPYIGVAFFNQHPFVLLSLISLCVLSFFYRNTVLKLHIVAAGSNPAALDSFGVNVLLLRTGMVLFTGLMAGLGGAYMATIAAGIFVPMMINGAGFIAIVLAMLAHGKPLWIFFGSFLFGCSLSIATALQLAGTSIPIDFVHMLPFVVIMLVLIIFARHNYLPPALGVPYLRGER